VIKMSKGWVIRRIKKTYDELKSLPKPESRRAGGQYYGRTQLYRSVGNMLDYIENGTHTHYGYGGNTNYVEVTAIKVGGAYSSEEARKLINSLLEYLRENINTCEGFRVIYSAGTNFSVIGIGKPYHG
jgi:hypothetical protein